MTFKRRFHLIYTSEDKETQYRIPPLNRKTGKKTMLLLIITSKADKLAAELCAVCMSNNRDKDIAAGSKSKHAKPTGWTGRVIRTHLVFLLLDRRSVADVGHVHYVGCPLRFLLPHSSSLLLLEQKHSHFPSPLLTAPLYSSPPTPLNDAFNCYRGLPPLPASSRGSGSDGGPTLCALPWRGSLGAGWRATRLRSPLFRSLPLSVSLALSDTHSRTRAS